MSETRYFIGFVYEFYEKGLVTKSIGNEIIMKVIKKYYTHDQKKAIEFFNDWKIR